jgi:hypothetical protein
MTIKQKLAAKKILENPRLPIGKVMEEVGYSPNTAVHPKDLTESKGFNELMEQYLPNEKVLKTHEEGLEATKQLSVRGGKDANAESDDFIEVPDHPTRLKAVELAYKVKGKLKDGGVAVQINNIIPILGGATKDK